MENDKKTPIKKNAKGSIQGLSAREVGRKFLEELKAQGPKKGTLGSVYITKAVGEKPAK